MKIFAESKLSVCLGILFALFGSAGWAQTQPAGSTATTAPASAAPAKSSSRKPPSPSTNATDAEIAAAKASGKVWVNTETKKYHSGGRWYGKTKEGKFMTVDEAKKEGYVAAKNE
jgi:hypothetical protein